MIEIIFERGLELTLVVINGHTVRFGKQEERNILADIDGLRIDKEGVVKEFPDLKEDPDWRKKAINRFKNKIKEIVSKIR
jgi:hypothetical protein